MPASDPSGGGTAAGSVTDAPTIAAPAVVGSGPGGPLAAQGGPGPGFTGPTDLSRRGMGERPKPHYGRHALSPIPHMVIALVTGVIAVVVTHWALQPVDDPSRRGLSSDWWNGLIEPINQQVHLDFFFLHPRSIYNLTEVDRPRLWFAIGALAVALIVLVAWVRRLGQNARADAGFFGALLVIGALPAWWALPLGIGGEFSSLSEARLRTTSAMLLILVQALFARWAFVHKLWRGGRLPYEPIAYLLWIPTTIASLWVWGSWTWTMYSIEEDDRIFKTRWLPTENIARMDQWATRITAVLVLALLVVVTISQHQGIKEDEQVAEEWNQV